MVLLEFGNDAFSKDPLSPSPPPSHLKSSSIDIAPSDMDVTEDEGESHPGSIDGDVRNLITGIELIKKNMKTFILNCSRDD